MTRDWSVPIDGQFSGIDGCQYMMTIDGSAYRFCCGKFEPITRSYYGHMLKTTRKSFMKAIADVYRRRSLARKAKDWQSIDTLDKRIVRYEAEFKKGIDKAWNDFRSYVGVGRAERRLDRIYSKGKAMTRDEWLARQQ